MAATAGIAPEGVRRWVVAEAGVVWWAGTGGGKTGNRDGLRRGATGAGQEVGREEGPKKGATEVDEPSEIDLESRLRSARCGRYERNETSWSEIGKLKRLSETS